MRPCSPHRTDCWRSAARDLTRHARRAGGRPPGRRRESVPAVASVGLVDADGTVRYSVLLTGGETDIADVIVSGALPDDADFVEIVHTPAGNEATGAIVADGEAGGAVIWSVATLPAHTILGPFTYRVAPTGVDVEIPLAASAVALWDGGTARTSAPEGALAPLADSGSITVDAAGTDGLVAVGETGVLLQVPPEAVETATTLTFTRLSIETSADLLPARDDLWWCSLWEVAVDPAVEFARPVRLALPNRAVLTPGLAAEGFILGPEEAGETAPAGVVTFPGTQSRRTWSTWPRSPTRS